MRKIAIAAVVVLLCGYVYGQTPDGETPANEGVCDDLMFASPGLYGLCVAFCEAQDCVPDPAAADPFANCRPSSPKLLEIYNRKKQPSDPSMPCYYEEECPCWSPEELAGLRYPSGTDFRTDALKDQTTPDQQNHDLWLIFNGTPYYATIVETKEWDWMADGPTCALIDVCGDFNCLWVNRYFGVTDSQFAVCEAQLNQSGLARGFEIFANP